MLSHLNLSNPTRRSVRQIAPQPAAVVDFRFMPAARFVVAARFGIVAVTAIGCLLGSLPAASAAEIDFNRDIKPLLSNQCFFCHGPDEAERQGGLDGLRLDTQEGAHADQGGHAAIVPGDAAASELIRRITSDDDGEVMPPPGTGRRLTPAEVELMSRWIDEGGDYATHWSYVPPTRPDPPPVAQTDWPRNPIDQFILARLESEGLRPQPPADPHALVRRLALDLTGLPPTPAETLDFVAEYEADPSVYEKWVDHFLSRPGYGEHWARLWLDLARYADSAGYADDPARTIWLYRDYVIDSIQRNKPFDQFTIEQIAGDLLPDPTDEQRIATAFHRNTLTNNEGGTDDEEFRNAAIVDRVNTTLAVWMGTTIACAQCHSHKYDPITHEEYFRVFAILNNTEDADRRDEAPLHSVYTDDQRQTRDALTAELAALRDTLTTPTPELLAARDAWAADFPLDLAWRFPASLEVVSEAASKVTITTEDDAIPVVSVAGGPAKDTYNVSWTAGTANEPLRAIRLETLADPSLPGGGPGHAGGNFVINQVRASWSPPAESPVVGRFVRIEIPGKRKMLSLAEVEIFSSGTNNIAGQGAASQSSTGYNGPPELAIDGYTDGRYETARSTTHTEISDDPWWEVDLKSAEPIERLVIWNRTDEGTVERLKDFRVAILGEDRQTLWEQTVAEPPRPSVELVPSGPRPLRIVRAFAAHHQSGFEPAGLLDPAPATGWAVGGATGQSHALVLMTDGPVAIPVGSRINLTIDQQSPHASHTLGRFRISTSSDPRTETWAMTPPAVIAALEIAADNRDDAAQKTVTDFYLGMAPALQPQRQRVKELDDQLAKLQPITVPVMRELPTDKRRQTHIQLRGNFMVKGDEVQPGTPAAFHPLPADVPADRLALANWLVDPANPLTARVIANRYWEKLLGTGIVATSEEFGSQGELPSHPELLDWLATELVRRDWDTQALIKLIVMSAAYRQASQITPEVLQADPDNRLVSRGPRFRLTAETIRDQALAVAGLLSDKRFGPPVNPPQPSIGLSAAFGSGIDWKTSEGEDRYRRGLYTTWRRSNPYPSMATFDAPNREVCTLRRGRSNTPLQALVTLNDPVFVEAAQGLARRMVTEGGDEPADRIAHGFLLCLSRTPQPAEAERLLELWEATLEALAGREAEAMRLATEPLGPLPTGADPIELAAWTALANVLLNLDETLMRR
ncbi:MAG: DUF1553 domain-containing protein [Planctomycetaceae bacterium]|nr:MAG: DUF1553 domain-containing protein [Planctomycetaceae bacterium]